MSDDVIRIGPASGLYRPVRVEYAGQEYVFGRSALSVFRALNLGADLKEREGEDKAGYAARILAALPDLAAALCPDFPAAPWDVDTELAVFGVVTEVLKRAGEIRFPSSEG